MFTHNGAAFYPPAGGNNMNILVLNGSPRGSRSNSLKLTNAFLDGFTSVSKAETEIIEIYKLNLHPCLGCFSCWNKTPGRCVIDDDMKGIIDKIISADMVIFSFPLYYFSLPSQLKMLIDRLLPLSLPFMQKNSESGGHPSRYDMGNKKYVMISTCGFYTAQGNYDAVNAQFDRIYGKGNYTGIYCGQGELFSVPQLHKRTCEYLEYVKTAGREYASGRISQETENSLHELLFPREVYEKMADASWGIERTSDSDESTAIEPALVFTKEMAALYNPASWKGKDLVLEFYYTDIKKKYQIVMQEKGHKVLTRDFLPCTTRIETPLSVWERIGSGELDGRRAMMDHLYRVTGDFDIMLRWNDYFGAASPAETDASKRDGKTNAPEKANPKKTNMSLMLLPWITIWIALAIDSYWGGIAGIAVCSIIPFAFLKWKPTVFEYISLFSVSFISILSVTGIPVIWLLPASYLIFGIMWTVTAFMKIPLSAYYSMNNYGMDEALSNPLFMRTNRILTLCWGVLYLLTPIWTYFLLKTSFGSLTGAINSVLPILLGIFTVWFQKWYPRHYAQK